MFYRLLFLLSIISPFILSAQIATEIKLEPALISVIYERRMEYDTLNRNNKVRINTLTLKAGKNHSAFYDARLKWIDSMEYINDDYIHSLYEGVKYYSTKGALHQIKLFKNYPEGKIRIHDAFDLCRWHIDEDIEKPEWNIIADSTTNILGYECMLAVARFRGRVWHAWFSPEIPFPEGPWKLWGLPGLILKAYDSNQDYIFTAQEISDMNTGYVEYFDYAPPPTFTTSRRKALQRKWKVYQEDISYKVAMSGMLGDTKLNVKKREIPPPKYDFEETDYSHE